jgi:periplasmic divalent cation tolerance protein
MSETVLIYTTWPDAETAERVGTEAVNARLAACANVLAPAASIYRWKGAVERSGETPMILKTRAELSEPLRIFLTARHPYETPAIIALPTLTDGSNPAFLDWIAAETRAPEGDPVED